MISPQKHCDHECVCMGYSHREESIDDLPCPKDPCIYRSLPAPVTTFTILSSEELILLAENDWHNREERKHLHPKIPWVSGWITGFLSMSKLNWSAQHDTRSRPAPPPKTWESCMEHVTCPNGEECWYLSEDFHNEEKAAIAVKARKLEILAAGTAVGTTVVTVGTASATTLDLNTTLGPILDGIVALIPSIINLIVAIVPAIIVLAIVGFIVGFLKELLNMLKL